MQLYRQISGDGPHLIIIHGLLGASGNWASLVRSAYAPHFRTVTPDLRNHGRSPHAPEFSYPAMASDVLELMDEEGIERAHLIGHSMGGKLAIHLALNHPERIDRLVVADIGPRAYIPSHEAIFNAMEALHPERYASRPEVDEAFSRHITDPGLRQFLLKSLDREDDGYRWGINLPAIRQGYPEIIGAIDSWETFDGDVLFVGGSQSSYLSESDLPLIRALFPFAELTMIEGAGHWLHADRP
ncbi:MAG: alpha/beta fold hydrolase, partial [Bacteroidetes bacterium]|nr:alpha/beta fold hydrolase [Bacteroidota bacterium]